MTTNLTREQRFDWPLCYEAESYIVGQLDGFLQRNKFGRELAERMIGETGTLFLDWVDHISVSNQQQAALTGYSEDPLGDGSETILWHPEAMLPRVVLNSGSPDGDLPSRIGLRVESISDFMVAHRLSGEPEGAPLSQFRRVAVAEENGTQLEVVERRGYRGFSPQQSSDPANFLKAQELWKTRRCLFDSDEEGFACTHAILDRVVDLLGRDLACHVVFEQERAYWQSRNRAGQIQKARQDKLGLGWANHDHHTFRSSRRHFVDLMRALEKLGFERREERNV
jgi:hypothetical protein